MPTKKRFFDIDGVAPRDMAGACGHRDIDDVSFNHDGFGHHDFLPHTTMDYGVEINFDIKEFQRKRTLRGVSKRLFGDPRAYARVAKTTSVAEKIMVFQAVYQYTV